MYNLNIEYVCVFHIHHVSCILTYSTKAIVYYVHTHVLSDIVCTYTSYTCMGECINWHIVIYKLYNPVHSYTCSYPQLWSLLLQYLVWGVSRHVASSGALASMIGRRSLRPWWSFAKLTWLARIGHHSDITWRMIQTCANWTVFLVWEFMAEQDSGSTRVPLWAREALYHVSPGLIQTLHK